MEEKNKKTTILLVIVIILLVGICGYLVYDKVPDKKDEPKSTESKEESKENNGNGGSTETNTKEPQPNSNYDLKDTYKESISLNDGSHNLVIYYYNSNDETTSSYHWYREVYLDDTLVVPMIEETNNSNNADLYKKNTYYTKVKDANNNSEYLVLSIANINGDDGSTQRTLIFDEKGTIIYANDYADSFSKVIDLCYSSASDAGKKKTELNEGKYCAYTQNGINTKFNVADNYFYTIEADGTGTVTEYQNEITNGKLEKREIYKYTPDSYPAELVIAGSIM